MKLRVVGAELRSDRPAEPLEAARWAMLLLAYNSVSPVAWDTKLGPVKLGHTLRCGIGTGLGTIWGWGRGRDRGGEAGIHTQVCRDRETMGHMLRCKTGTRMVSC
jgi:hypothetical protein